MRFLKYYANPYESPSRGTNIGFFCLLELISPSISFYHICHDSIFTIKMRNNWCEVSVMNFKGFYSNFSALDNTNLFLTI